MTDISCTDDVLLKSLISFYKNEKYLNIVIEIVTQKTALSLRLLDWLVTNYSKTENINYVSNDRLFNIYKSYKCQLKAYSKKHFDPFLQKTKNILYI